MKRKHFIRSRIIIPVYSTIRVLLLVIITAVSILQAGCVNGGSITVVISNEPASAAPSAVRTTAPVTPTIVPTPVLTPTPAPDPISLMISQMNDRELIGQMVMIGFDGTTDMDKNRVELMKEYYVGNIIFFGWNTDSFSQTKELIAKIKEYNNGRVPLTFCIDVEGGMVTRFIGQWDPSLNSAQVLGQKGDTQKTYDQYFRIGEKLKEIGFTLDLAPVLDISHNPANTFLGKDKRMFGSDPDEVSAHVRRAVDGLQDSGIASLGKHFPGHGETPDDSHKTLPVIDATLNEMREYSLIPFQAAIDEGIDAMLVAHLLYPNVDDKNITSVSPLIIDGILRKEMGFDGVVLSDDMRMEGILDTYTAGEAAVRFVQAGGDIVLIGKNKDMQKDVLDSLYKALQDGTFTRQRLEQSVRRIISMKLKYA